MLQQCSKTWTMLTAGGSPYAVIAILDTIAAIKPNVATVAFGLVASTATVLLVSWQRTKQSMQMQHHMGSAT